MKYYKPLIYYKKIVWNNDLKFFNYYYKSIINGFLIIQNSIDKLKIKPIFFLYKWPGPIAITPLNLKNLVLKFNDFLFKMFKKQIYSRSQKVFKLNNLLKKIY